MPNIFGSGREMIASRRGFLVGAGALLAAPAIVRVSALMPISVPKDPPWLHKYSNNVWIIDDPHATDFNTDDLIARCTERYHASWLDSLARAARVLSVDDFSRLSAQEFREFALHGTAGQ